MYERVKITIIKFEDLFVFFLYSLRPRCIKIIAGVKNINEKTIPTIVSEMIIPSIPKVKPTVHFAFIVEVLNSDYL